MGINIYQVFTRLFRNDEGANVPHGEITQNGCSKFNHFSKSVLKNIRKMGYSHVWFTGIIRHATTTAYPEFGIEADNPAIVKGKAGSPYAIKDYFDVDPDLAENVRDRMQEFESLVERCHNEDLKVIIDFVPNHVSRQYKGTQRPEGIPDLGENDDDTVAFSVANNFYYIPGQPLNLPDELQTNSKIYYENPAKATGNDVFRPDPTISDWYETVKLNYGVDYFNDANNFFDPIPPTWHRMYEILEFWAAKGVDAFRVDMAEMVPVPFWSWVIKKIKSKDPEIKFIAEIYQPKEYERYIKEGGFDWLYDKEQFYNILRSVVEKKAPASDISNIWKSQGDLSQNMLRFMENHDEQRIASGFFAGNPCKAWPAMVLAGTMHTGPLMIYFGQEIGEPGMDAEGFSGKDGRTTIFDYWQIEKYQKWVNSGEFGTDKLSRDERYLICKYVDLLLFRRHYNVIREGAFYDLMWANQQTDTQNIYAYLRHTNSQVILVVLNFHSEAISNINLKVPHHATQHVGMEVQNGVIGKVVFGKCEDYDIRKNENDEVCIELTLGKYETVILDIFSE